MKKYQLIHERGDYPPLATEEIASVWSGDIKKTVGDGESPLYFIYRDGWCRIFSLEKVHRKIADRTFKTVSQNRKFVGKVKNKFDMFTLKALAFIDNINKTDWKSVTNMGLLKTKNTYVRLYHKLAPFGEPLPYFLKDNLQNKLEQYLLREKQVSAEEFSVLLTPLYQSFLKREEKELWALIRTAKNRQNLDDLIAKHQRRYEWLLFDYASIKVDKPYFIKKAKNFIKAPPQFIDYRKLRQRKMQIIKKYHIEDLYRYYLAVLEDLFYLMDRKKEILTQLHFGITPLYQEIAKRLNLDLESSRWYLWKELKNALALYDKFNSSLCRRRRHFCVLSYKNGKGVFLNIFRARMLLSQIAKDEKVDLRQVRLKGIAACPGIVRGTVCYLKSARENGKIKKGQILVVSNTTPDFMPAIHKAAGIITNEGGVTSHAAIVSRELGIPCIVGTKIATQILKDGDMIEVNANNGFIKKLHR